MDEPIDQRQPLRVSGTKLIVGLFFAAAGVLMTAENLDLLDAERYLRYWPVVLLLVGLVKLADSSRRLAGVVFTVLGASLLAYNAGWVHVHIFDLWPLLLIVGGIGMVARSLAGPRTAEGRDARNIIAIFSAPKIVNTSDDFRGARIIAVMGGCDLDLTNASIAEGPAVIEAIAVWGGIEITVPDDWEVIGEVVPVMAGFDIRAVPETKPRRQLIVRGTAVMAGIEVKRRKA